AQKRVIDQAQRTSCSLCHCSRRRGEWRGYREGKSREERGERKKEWDERGRAHVGGFLSAAEEPECQTKSETENLEFETRQQSPGWLALPDESERVRVGVCP